MLDEVLDDPGYPLLRPDFDLRMLLTFLERFDSLGWIPPLDHEKLKILSAHNVTMHPIGVELCFYEFSSKGARGERNPWLTIFFHVDGKKCVRVCGLGRTDRLQRRYRLFTEAVRIRVEQLDEWLRYHPEA